MKKIKDKGISVNERRQYKSGGQEMNFIVQQLVKYGNTKSDAIKMTRKHYNDVLKRYKEPWFVHPIKKAEIISSLSANESVDEGKYTVHFDVGSSGLMSKTVNANNAKDAARQVASGLKDGAKLIRKIEKESINEASAIQKIDKLAKRNKYGTVDGTQMNGKTAREIIAIFKHPKMNSYRNQMLKMKSHELVDLTLRLLKPLKINVESVNEGMTKYNIRLTKTPGWYGIWDTNGKQKAEGDKKYITKFLKALKTRMGSFQLKSLVDLATDKKGKDISFDVVESVKEAKYKGYDYKRQNRKDGLSLIVPALRKTFSNMKDLKKYIDKHGKMESVKESDLGLTYKKGKTVKVRHKTSGKSLIIIDKPNVRKEYEKIGYYVEGFGGDLKGKDKKEFEKARKENAEQLGYELTGKSDIRESINEAPGKSGKDGYFGQAMVKVEPHTYKNQKRDFHDVSMYRDHKKPYHYYLSIRLAHSNKVDMVIDTGTHIQSKAGKWAQGFIKRRVGGTGKERFS